MRIAELAVLAVLFALSLEMACRFEDWIQYGTPLFAPERSQLDLLVRDTLGMHGRPGGHYQKWTLNSFGMRGPEVTTGKPTHTLRVVTSGASETFGLYESVGKEYPRQLEDSLNAVLGASRCVKGRAQVLNAAMPGMSLPTIEQDIRLRVAPLKPDFVVLYPTPAAYLDDGLPSAARPDSVMHLAWAMPKYSALIPRVADRMRSQMKALLPTFVQDALRRREIDRMLRSRPKDWRFSALPQDRLTAFDKDLRAAVTTVRRIGAVPVLVTHANRFSGSGGWNAADLRLWEKFYPRAPGPTIVAFDSAARLVTLKVATDLGTPVVDLAPVLGRTRGAGFADYAHFSDLGASVAAANVTHSIVGVGGVTKSDRCADSR